MGDSQGNPFIGNPFMQGASKQRSQPDSPSVPKPAEPDQTTAASSPPPLRRQSSGGSVGSRASDGAAYAKPGIRETQTEAKTSIKQPRDKSASVTGKKPRAKRTQSATKSSPSVARGATKHTGGYKVQVLAKIPMPNSPGAPSRDYLWFAVYPIIPRVGDCLFHDGRYFRVDAVFLYESTNASWCADVEVSYYSRRSI